MQTGHKFFLSLCMLLFAKVLPSGEGITIPLLESGLDYVTYYVQRDPSTININRRVKTACTWGLACSISIFQRKMFFWETRTSLLEDRKLRGSEVSCLSFQKWSPLDLTSYEGGHPRLAPGELPCRPSLVAQMVKNLPAMQETQV